MPRRSFDSKNYAVDESERTFRLGQASNMIWLRVREACSNCKKLPGNVCPIFENMSLSCRLSFAPAVHLGKVAETSFPAFLLNLKEDVGVLILNLVAICYNIMRAFILDFNIAQIFKWTLKCGSTWPFKLPLSTIFTLPNFIWNRIEFHSNTIWGGSNGQRSRKYFHENVTRKDSVIIGVKYRNSVFGGERSISVR